MKKRGIILKKSETPSQRSNLSDLLLDKNLAKLGDSYINFLYSIAMTITKKEPTGIKVSDRLLALAAKEAGMRVLLPKRTPIGRVADAVEVLLIHSVISGSLKMKDMIEILLESEDDTITGFKNIIIKALSKVKDI